MDRDGKIARIARRQWGVVSRVQIAAQGGNRAWIARRTEEGSWREVFPGVLQFSAVPETWLMRAHAVLLWLGKEAVLGRRSAAFLHGWMERAPRVIDVSVPRSRSPRHAGVAIHRVEDLGARDITEKQGLRLTSVPRTLLDLAGERDLEELLESAVFRADGKLHWIQQRVAKKQRGSRGLRRLRRLVSLRSSREQGADSLLEARVARLLQRAKLHPAHHLTIFDASGDFICEADFAWPEQRVIVEVDGRKFHSSRAAFLKRSDALQRLAAEGWVLVPVTWDDVKARPEEFLRRLRETLSNSRRPERPVHRSSSVRRRVGER